MKMIGSTIRVDAHGSGTEADTRGGGVRVDMHCHSTASQVSKLGVQRALGLPECATPPLEVYELAKRRGMDFVTITDHDTIEGVLTIADRPDVFVSEELTAHFRGEPQAVHVLCYGITAEDHEWLQANSGDVELCAMYLYDREIACALAHPYYAVGAPLTARHRRRLAELFGIWETRNGARARELNRPAAMYVETREGIGIGGSDDHAGIDIGRTWTAAPTASTPEEFLAHMRAGRVTPEGKQGSAAKWAHAAIALAARSLGSGDGGAESTAPDPQRVMRMAQRVLREGDVRHGANGADLTPADARCLLRAWLAAVELDHLDEGGLIAHMQEEGFSHSDLHRRACRLHERKLRDAVERAAQALTGTSRACACAGAHTRARASAPPTSAPPTRTHNRPTSTHNHHSGDHDTHPREGDHEVGCHAGQPPTIDPGEVRAAAGAVFEGCIAAIPYAPATAFLANEQAKLSRYGAGSDEPPRVAILADGIGSTHGVTRTIEEIRRRGVPGYEIEVVGTDADVDRRLSAVAELEVPYYPGLRIGVPSLSAAVQTLTSSNGEGYDALHVCSPGPTGIAGALLARALGLPLVGSYHTELTAYARLRAGEPGVVEAMGVAVGMFYNACDLVLSPSAASDETLAAIGVPREKVARWDRGVDTSRFDPALRARAAGARERGDRIDVLYAGRITYEKGAQLLVEAFTAAREREQRLHLVLAGGGPEQEWVRERVGEHATFLGWLTGAELARAYARADVFLFASATDTFGQVILEAQASGVPVVAVAAGGPLTLIEDRVTGLLREADPVQLADAVMELAGSPLLRERLAQAALGAVRERTWERALAQLAAGYSRALAGGAGGRAGGAGAPEDGGGASRGSVGPTRTARSPRDADRLVA
jgi:glycosyltransferase involved in cell wall biosynthesis/predicted metal-dependent phosphoesterase TrpH